jgi:RNA polymerase sigma-70 factor (sigma-E family)
VSVGTDGESTDSDFAEYAAARWPVLLRSAVFLGCSAPEAEDLVQTTLLRCYTSWRKVALADHRDAYVSRMLVNAFRESRRRRWWGERPIGDPTELDVAVPDGTDDLADTASVRRALAGVPVPQREVVVLRYYLQLSERETADALRIPPGTVKSRLSAALKHLATALEPSPEEH